MADPLTLIDYIAPIVGVLSIAFAAFIALQINKYEIGTEKMTEIYNAIRTGSKAYLYRQYKTKPSIYWLGKHGDSVYCSRPRQYGNSHTVIAARWNNCYVK